MSSLINRLRSDIRDTQADINRIDGQQETAKVQLEQLLAEAEKLGFPPDAAEIRAEVTLLEQDVESALESVREEVKSLGIVVHPGQ